MNNFPAECYFDFYNVSGNSNLLEATFVTDEKHKEMRFSCRYDYI